MPLKRRGDDQDQEMKLTLTQSTILILSEDLRTSSTPHLRIDFEEVFEEMSREISWTLRWRVRRRRVYLVGARGRF